MCIYRLEKKEESQGRIKFRVKMYIYPVLSVSICIFFHISIHPTTSFLIRQPGDIIIQTTCKQCAEKSSNFNYNLCVTSLQSVPLSHATNLQGLALVAMELALENATSTIKTIEKMLSSKAFDPFSMDCLTDCLELYGDSVSLLVSSIASFLLEQFDAANILMTAVIEEVATCDEGFTEEKGEVTLLANENYNIFQISSIAVCITKLLSV